MSVAHRGLRCTAFAVSASPAMEKQSSRLNPRALRHLSMPCGSFKNKLNISKTRGKTGKSRNLRKSQVNMWARRSGHWVATIIASLSTKPPMGCTRPSSNKNRELLLLSSWGPRKAIVDMPASSPLLIFVARGLRRPRVGVSPVAAACAECASPSFAFETTGAQPPGSCGLCFAACLANAMLAKPISKTITRVNHLYCWLVAASSLSPVPVHSVITLATAPADFLLSPLFQFVLAANCAEGNQLRCAVEGKCSRPTFRYKCRSARAGCAALGGLIIDCSERWRRPDRISWLGFCSWL